jgi:hypothetical protein
MNGGRLKTTIYLDNMPYLTLGKLSDMPKNCRFYKKMLDKYCNLMYNDLWV